MSNDPRAIGEHILHLMEGRSASIFKRDYWNGQIMEWSMQRPDFKTEMFRFVDVLPVLNDSTELARHIQEYFCRDGLDFPAPLQWGLKTLQPDSIVAKLAAGQIERNVTSMARTFIAGKDADDAVKTLKTLWKKQQLAFTIDLLGEKTVSHREARQTQREYLHLIDTLAQHASSWPSRPTLETDAFGPIPRVNLSVKLSALEPNLHPVGHRSAVKRLTKRLLPICKRAIAHNVFINLDMEHYALKPITLDLFKHLLSHKDLPGLQLGCVLQAYLHDAHNDLKDLIRWGKKHNKTFTVRLVKGAYWDYETMHAEQMGWPVPVHCDKASTDANYEALTTTLLDNIQTVRPAFASHNVRSIAHAISYARSKGVADNAYEFQMLYGMAEPLKYAIQKMGFRLREYVPVGALIPGMAYLVRRLLENTSNESWLRAKFADNADNNTLLAPPKPTPRRAQKTPSGYPATGQPCAPPHGAYPFRNEALADFSLPSTRSSIQDALDTVKQRSGSIIPLVIGGQPHTTPRTLPSRNPAQPSDILAISSLASNEDVEDAIELASRAFPSWRDTPVEDRARVLFKTAALMREKKAELTALIVLESGKSWPGADADVCEAIDFLEYYGRQAISLMRSPQRTDNAPGELNHITYEPRGLCAVIAPWNFPLAILTGMASAALVTGNCVLLKPAEQTPATAYTLISYLLKSGLPPNVCHFLPGYGEEIGAHLVQHHAISTIAFTGSLQVGLSILRDAAVVHPGQRHIKRVIAELGGKNAIIVDSDADLDEAIDGVLHSAFNFQGQKCSACSRVIVLKHNYDLFVERLAEAVQALAFGTPEDPSTDIGPVIDQEAFNRLNRALQEAQHNHTTIAQLPVPSEHTKSFDPTGHYIPPTILGPVEHDSKLAQNELFGPILAVLKADSFDHAIQLAMSTPYALTAGLYSRSPAHIAQARSELRVGNLYINRSITGALVQRQPFGGAAMSGVGSKAGGPDYLLQFTIPRTITENAIRRGFAPDEDNP